MSEVDVTYQRNTYSLSTSYNIAQNDMTSALTWVCPHRTVSYDMSAHLDPKKASYDVEIKWEADKLVSFQYCSHRSLYSNNWLFYMYLD